jgi:hypothetical protein
LNPDQASDAGPLRWRKSSYSNAGNNCVEVADCGATRAVRDSKAPDGGQLTFSAQAWQAFTADVKRGRLAL